MNPDAPVTTAFLPTHGGCSGRAGDGGPEEGGGPWALLTCWIMLRSGKGDGPAATMVDGENNVRGR
ncbi:hypothetical protein GCM10027612_16060 [Microbispora bryophytorum subsp. camponoti]